MAGARRRELADEIQYAALQLFARLGYDEVTVEMIAAEVDVHPRTVLRHFRSKEDILMAYGRRSGHAICAELGHRPADESPVEALYHAVSLTAPRTERDHALSRLWAEAVKSRPDALVSVSVEHMHELADTMAARLEASMDADVAHALSWAMTGALHGLWRKWTDDGAVGDFAEVARNGLLMLESLTSPPHMSVTNELERLRRENETLQVDRELFRAAAAALLDRPFTEPAAE